MAAGNDRNPWSRLKDRLGEKRANALAIILLIGAASIAVRVLMHYDFDRSALLYIGIPYLVSLAIVVWRPVTTEVQWWHQYRDHSLTALAVFLASSIVLFEGFVCVVFFLPIYFLAISIAFLFSWVAAARKPKNGKTLVSILPVLLIASSLEGTSDYLAFDRESQVSVSKVANLSVAEIKSNLATPIDLQKKRHWLLSVFPMPYEIEAGSLNPGDIHRIHTRYHRWFVTNTHVGEQQLQIVAVGDDYVRTRFISDTSYFASYLTPLGTEIRLTELAPGKTKITLRIDYRRELDPAWYFHPLQQFGVGKMAEFLIDEVMIRN